MRKQRNNEDVVSGVEDDLAYGRQLETVLNTDGSWLGVEGRGTKDEVGRRGMEETIESDLLPGAGWVGMGIE